MGPKATAAAATSKHRERDYVRVPSDMQQEISALAARYDVPVRSLTRVLLCLGLECLRLDDTRIAAMLKRLGVPEQS